MTATDELLSCPFCGGKAKVGKYCDECTTAINFKCARDISHSAECQIGEKVFWVEHDCPRISADDGVLGTACFASAREAIEAWNERAVRKCKLTPDGMMDGKMWLACSECHGYVSADYDPPKYCPHCGCEVK